MAVLGGMVTAAVIAVVIWEAVQPASPPTLGAVIVGIHRTAAGQVAVVKVVNTGDDTASAVDIEGVLGKETATATLDYVPSHGHAKAYLRFDGDARLARISVKGWSAP